MVDDLPMSSRHGLDIVHGNTQSSATERLCLWPSTSGSSTWPTGDVKEAEREIEHQTSHGKVDSMPAFTKVKPETDDLENT